MDNQQVLYGMLIYVLYVVMPLLPSIIIYKLFPNTSVGANGVLGNLKINATGAFAAYIITVILGHYVIKQNLDFVRKIDKTNWEIKSKVEFVDTDGNLLKEVSDLDLKNKLIIKTTPDYNVKNLNGIVFIAYAKGELPKVTFSYPGYEPKLMDLDAKDESIIKDFAENKIDLGTIRLVKQRQKFDASKFENDTIIQPNPVPFEGPPTINEK